MVHKPLVFTCKILGMIAMIGSALWGFMAVALDEFPRAPGYRVVALLMMAPLAVLPAGIMAETRPRWAGAGLVGAAVASGLWCLFVLDGFSVDSLSARGVAIYLLSTSLPLGILGAAFLRMTAPPAPASRAAAIYAGVHVIATLLIAVAAIVVTLAVAASFRWTLTVTPSGGDPVAVMLEPREAKAELQRKISSALEPAFRAPARPGGGILGRFELTGKVPPGEDRRMTYEIRLAPDGKEVNVYRNDLPKEMSFLRGDTLAFVRSQAASSVYEVVVMSRRAPQR